MYLAGTLKKSRTTRFGRSYTRYRSPMTYHTVRHNDASQPAPRFLVGTEVINRGRPMHGLSGKPIVNYNDLYAHIATVARAVKESGLHGYQYDGLGFSFGRVFKNITRAVTKVALLPVTVTKEVVKAVERNKNTLTKVAGAAAVGAAIWYGSPYLITMLKQGGGVASDMITRYTAQRSSEGAPPTQITDEVAKMMAMAATPTPPAPQQYQPLSPDMQPANYVQQPMPSYQSPQPAQTAQTAIPSWLLPAIAIGSAILLRS